MISFDWAMKRLLRNKANFEVLEETVINAHQANCSVETIAGITKLTPAEINIILENQQGAC